MIFGFVIVDAETGFPLVSRFYKNLGIEPERIAAFLSALWTLLEWTASAPDEKGNIRSEVIAGYRWSFLKEGRLLFAGVADVKYNPLWLEEQLKYLRDEFFKHFPEMTDRKKVDLILSEAKGDPSRWATFVNTIDEAVESWLESNKRAYAAQVLDIIEVYQQFINVYTYPLSEEEMNTFAVQIENIAQQYGVVLKPSANPLDISDRIDVLEASYSSVRGFLMALFDVLYEIVRKKLGSDYVKFVQEKVNRLVKSELDRIDIYNLKKNIFPKILT
ncbi:MAG: hypothetical protein ACTSSP_02585 [Candidatus Asgardarchaeia archaeon]